MKYKIKVIIFNEKIYLCQIQSKEKVDNNSNSDP